MICGLYYVSFISRSFSFEFPETKTHVREKKERLIQKEFLSQFVISLMRQTDHPSGLGENYCSHKIFSLSPLYSLVDCFFEYF